MQVKVYSDKLTKLTTDLLVVTCFRDVRPLRGLASKVDWYYGGILSRALIEQRFTGDLGKMLLLSTEGKLNIPKVILLGLGVTSRYGYAKFTTASRKLLSALKTIDIGECAVEIDSLGPEKDKKKFRAVALVEAFRKGEGRSLQKKPLDVTFIVKENEKAELMQKYLHQKSSL